VDRIGTIPGLLHLRRALFARKFNGGMGHAFHGVFDSFDAAAAHAPETLPASYDNPASAGMYEDLLEIDDHDYPALFWLKDALADGLRRIVDVGGSTGIKFYAFGPLLRLPFDTHWHVIETPAAAKLGCEIAARKASGSQLEFSSDIGDADGCDILFASGSLQYLPRSLEEMLAAFRSLPRRILVNKTPIHPSRSFFTLNNIGTACCPYRVTSQDAFVRGIEARGYRLLAQWRNLAKPMNLPYEPGLGLECYSGFCFDRA
jgi:putative methyltransferase (TIGR04325 family)